MPDEQMAEKEMEQAEQSSQTRIIMGAVIGMFIIVFGFIICFLYFVAGCHGSEPAPGVYITKEIIYC